ncbi:MAG TPA: hypothetical protein VJN94_10890 [Candidatus Binataceae bacterium]|nr:hypothetical protein [Candidatus Binataceae bacterium]
MDQPITLPGIAEIAAWQVDRCQLERTRLRNELSFLRGDHAHGGPPREELAAALRSRLAAIDQRIASAFRA